MRIFTCLISSIDHASPPKAGVPPRVTVVPLVSFAHPDPMLRITKPLLRTKPSHRQLSLSACRLDAQRTLSYKGHDFPYAWLRDSCQCSACLHPSTSQKLHRTSDIPTSILPRTDGVRFNDNELIVTWTSGHQSRYTYEFLDRYASSDSLKAFHKDGPREEWSLETLKKSKDLFLPYDSLQTPSGLLSAITQLTRHGLLFVTSVPNDRTSNEDCELRKLGERFGELRRTFYGETWDVKNIRNSRNIAYTNVDLGLHMDLLYAHAPLFLNWD